MINASIRKRPCFASILTVAAILILALPAAINAIDYSGAEAQSGQAAKDRLPPDAKVKAKPLDVLPFKAYENLKITALDIHWPPDNCLEGKWVAMVANSNQSAVSELFLESSTFNEDQQKWFISSRSSVFSVDGNQSKTVEGRWYPGPFETKYKVVLYSKKANVNQPEERTVSLAIPATPNLEILQPEFIGNAWRVSVRNKGLRAECALSVQTFLVKQSTGERKAAGGLGLQIPPGGVNSVQNSIQEPDWRSRFDKIEVLLRRAPTWQNTPGPGWTTIKQQTFSIAP